MKTMTFICIGILTHYIVFWVWVRQGREKEAVTVLLQSQPMSPVVAVYTNFNFNRNQLPQLIINSNKRFPTNQNFGWPFLHSPTIAKVINIISNWLADSPCRCLRKSVRWVFCGIPSLNTEDIRKFEIKAKASQWARCINKWGSPGYDMFRQWSQSFL